MITDCSNFEGNSSSCKIANRLSGMVSVSSVEACNHCSTVAVPQRDLNAVTISLALMAVNRIPTKKKELLKQYGHFILDADVGLAAQRRLQAVLTGTGVGSQLWKLLESLKVKHKESCPCLDWAEIMNNWGPIGCRLARKEIVSHMEASAKSYGWGDVGRAFVEAIRSGLALKLSVLDPYGSLLDEAISRSEMANR